MSVEQKPTGSEPQNQNKEDNPEKGAGFDDLVGKEQPVNKIDGSPAKPEGEQPSKPGAEGQKPEAQPAADSGEKKGEGEPSSGKFKTLEAASKAHSELEKKLGEQGKELGELRTVKEENEKFLSALDKALAKNPDLADQLKTALAEVVKAQPEDEDGDLETLIDKKLEERDAKAKTKAEIDQWFEKHPDANENSGELGHKILDVIEKDDLPFNAKTLQLVYDALTKEGAAKKAAEAALKKEEIANLDREEGSAVGGGSPQAKGKVPQSNPFDEMVGSSVNPNKL
jgi:hypothetical protein